MMGIGFLQSLLQCLLGHLSDHPASHQSYSLYQKGTTFDDLPEDLVFSIMSKLNLRDLLKCSSLSKSWPHVVCCLDSFLFDIRISKDHAVFVKWVNQFLQHYGKLRSSLPVPVSLHYFAVVYYLPKHYSTDIDTWIATTLKYGVKFLTIYLAPLNTPLFPRPDGDKYIFPWQLLHEYSSTLEKICLRGCIFQCPSTSKWTSLVTLYLYDTPFTSDDADRVIHCFPNLRTLVIHYCTVPAKLTFARCSLTNLKVRVCPKLKEVVVLDSPVLKKFTYYGNLTPLKLVNAPKLAKLTFGFVNVDVENYVFQNLREDFPLMRTLVIFKDGAILPPLSRLYGRMSSLHLLQEFKLYNHPTCCLSIENMKQVLKACPILRRLKIMPPCLLEMDHTESPSLTPFRHKCLTYIKISGFCGSCGNVELAKFLIQVSDVLDHVVIQRKAGAGSYLYSKHSAKWHGEQGPESIKDILRSITIGQGRLTFFIT